MISMIKGLRKRARQIEKLCDYTIDIPEDEPKTKNNSQDVRRKSSSGGDGNKSQPKTTTPSPCKINTISTDCYPILTNVQFNPNWNGVQKQKWCNSAASYYNCIKVRTTDCLGIQYLESVTYYQKIQKYIHTQSNLNCPGGLEGCIINANDVRCKMGVKYGEVNGAKSFSTINNYSNYCLITLLTFFILLN
jgi:hypothetical protein